MNTLHRLREALADTADMLDTICRKIEEQAGPDIADAIGDVLARARAALALPTEPTEPQKTVRPFWRFPKPLGGPINPENFGDLDVSELVLPGRGSIFCLGTFPFAATVFVPDVTEITQAMRGQQQWSTEEIEEDQK